MKIFLFAALVFAAVAPCFSQQSKPQLIAPKKNISTATVKISDAEWKTLIAAWESEDWSKTSLLAAGFLQKIKTENDDRQLSRLRYIYLYALAGAAAAKKISFAELEKTARGFVGQDLLMPKREVLADCRRSVNYICAVGDNPKALRVTATDKSSTTIHFFEYVLFDTNLELESFYGKKAFLGGTLRKVETNFYESGLRVVRLILDGGGIAGSAADFR